MTVIIKATHSLSILITDRSSGWWATPNSSPFSLIIRMIRTQVIHSHDNEYNRFKREAFMLLNSLRILQINSLNHYSQHSEVISILHLSLFHLSYSSIPYSLLLWRTYCYSFQSIRISVLPTLFPVIISVTVRHHHTVSLSTHQSILMDTKQCMITIR